MDKAGDKATGSNGAPTVIATMASADALDTRHMQRAERGMSILAVFTRLFLMFWRFMPPTYHTNPCVQIVTDGLLAGLHPTSLRPNPDRPRRGIFGEETTSVAHLTFLSARAASPSQERQMQSHTEL